MAKGTVTNSTDTGTPGSYEPDTDFILQTVLRGRNYDYSILHVWKLRHRQIRYLPKVTQQEMVGLNFELGWP